MLQFISYIFSGNSENLDVYFLYILFIYYNIVISCIICSLTTFVNRASFFFLCITQISLIFAKNSIYFSFLATARRNTQRGQKNKRTTILNDTLILIHLFLNINAKLLSIQREKSFYLLSRAACAAARRAIGTRNGEQDT